MNILSCLASHFEHIEIGHLRQRYLWGPAVDQILAVKVGSHFPAKRSGLRRSTCRLGLESLGTEPSAEMRINPARFLTRFLDATFSDDGDCILDGIIGKRITVRRVTKSSQHPDLVLVECGFRDTLGAPKERAEGTLSLVLFPRQDWAIREFVMTSMRYAIETRKGVEVFQLADGRFAPRRVELQVRDLSSARTLREKYQFEITEMAVAASVGPEEFTVDALEAQRISP